MTDTELEPAKVMDDVERRLSRLEAALSAIPRVEAKLDVVVELTSSIKVIEGRQSDFRTALIRLSERGDVNQLHLARLEKEFTSKYSLIRGAVATATLFWVVLQSGVAFVLHDALDTVAVNNEAVIRIEQSHKDMGWRTPILQPKS